MNQRAKRILRMACPAAVVAAAPLAFTPEGGFEEQQACAQSGTCCPERESTCVIGSFSRANAYSKPEGSCQSQT